MLRAAAYFAVALLVACAPAARPAPATAQRPAERRASARNNVFLSFASDWDCVQDFRNACERAIAEHLTRTFAGYDVAFWTRPERGRVDGITLFFETSDPQEWGGGPRTVGYSPERCAPEVVDGTILGASAIFHCGDGADHGPVFCAGAAAHEVGHLLGLEHVQDAGDLMHHYYRAGNVFGRSEVAADNLCRGVQDDSAMLLAALGAAAL